jgi:hypothetical protein
MKQTTAQNIAEVLGDGALNTQVRQDRFTTVLLSQEPKRIQFQDRTRYEFKDGSSIVVSEWAWDLGIDDARHCGCWRGYRGYGNYDQHSEACDSAHEQSETENA